MLFCGMSIGFRGRDGDEVLDEYKKIQSTKVDPGCCCAWGRPTATWTRSPSGSSALWAWLDPPRRRRPASSTILMPEPTMYWFRLSATSTRSLTNSNSCHRTRRRDLALSHIQKLLHCAAIDAAQMSSQRGDVRRRVNGATHTTRMTNPIRASTATTPTIATNSGCIWTDTTGGSSDLPFSTKAAAPQPWSRAPAYHLGDEPLAAGLYPRAEWLWLPARNAFHGVVYRSRDSGCGSRGVE